MTTENLITIEHYKDIISILIDEKSFYTIQELLKYYIDSDRNFPLDISLEQLTFSIRPTEIVDVVFECGRFIAQN